MNSRVFLPLQDSFLANQDLTRCRESYVSIRDDVNNLYYDYDTAIKFDKSPIRRWWKVPLILAGVAQGLNRSTANPGSSHDKEKYHSYSVSKEISDCHLDSFDFNGSKTSFEFELDNCPRDIRDRAVEYFSSIFKSNVFKKIDQLEEHKSNVVLCRTISYNLPRKYGGLGLDGAISDRDRLRATYLHQNNIKLKSSQEQDWFFHNCVVDMLRKSAPANRASMCDSTLGPLYWAAFVIEREKNLSRYLKASPPDKKQIEFDRQNLKRMQTIAFDLSYYDRCAKKAKTYLKDVLLTDAQIRQNNSLSFEICYLGEQYETGCGDFTLS